MILLDALAFPNQVHFPLYINILRTPLLNQLVLNLTTPEFQIRLVLKHIFYRRSLVTRERVRRYAQFANLPGSHTALIRTTRQLGDKRLKAWISEQIAKIDVMTQIIWGAHDSLVPPPQDSILHHAIPSSEEPSIVDSGHVPHEELPMDTANLITTFLNSK